MFFKHFGKGINIGISHGIGGNGYCDVLFCNEGMAAEYEERHKKLWPEMKDMIHEYGGKNYSIFLDKETNTLFAYIEIESEEKWAKSANLEIRRKWWDYMADIMETNPDNSPVSVRLESVFHLD